MSSITISGLDKCIHLNCEAGETNVTFTVQDIYNTWVDWSFLSDNSKFGEAIRNTGGDNAGDGEKFGLGYFVQTSKGWKICPATTELQVRILIQGNLFPDIPGALIFDYDEVALGGHTHVETRTSTLPTILESGVSGLTTTESEALLDTNSLSLQIKILSEQILKLSKLIPSAL